jgi:hypothetical protein
MRKGLSTAGQGLFQISKAELEVTNSKPTGKELSSPEAGRDDEPQSREDPSENQCSPHAALFA